MAVRNSSYNSLAMARRRAGMGVGIVRSLAELAVSTNNAAGQGTGVGAVRGGADVLLKYKNVKSQAGLKTGWVENQVFGLAGNAFVVTGTVLSAIALPAMAKKTQTSFQELTALIHDPMASDDARLNKAEEFSRASAGTVFSAQGVVMGVQGTVGIMARTRIVGGAIAKVADSTVLRVVSPVGKVVNFLLPVADVLVLIGELISIRRTFRDPKSTPWQRLRKVLDFSLAVAKTAFWILPASKALKAIYAVASLGQLGLIVADFRKTLAPVFVRAIQTAGWAVGHPAEAAKAVITGTIKGIAAVVRTTLSVTGWVLDKATHPQQTLETAWMEARQWNQAYWQATGKHLLAVFEREQLARPLVQRPRGPVPTSGLVAPQAYGPPGYGPAAPAPAFPPGSAPAPGYAPPPPGYAPAPRYAPPPPAYAPAPGYAPPPPGYAPSPAGYYAPPAGFLRPRGSGAAPIPGAQSPEADLAYRQALQQLEQAGSRRPFGP